MESYASRLAKTKLCRTCALRCGLDGRTSGMKVAEVSQHCVLLKPLSEPQSEFLRHRPNETGK